MQSQGLQQEELSSPAHLDVMYDKTIQESISINDQSIKISKKTHQDMEKLIAMLLSYLVTVQSEISVNLEKTEKLGTQIQDDLAKLIHNITQDSIKKLEKINNELKSQKRTQRAKKWFGIFGAAAGCVLGFALGGVGGLAAVGLITGLTMSGATEKIQTKLAKAISGKNPPPEWANALSGIITTIACVIAAGGIDAGIETGIASLSSSVTSEEGIEIMQILDDEFVSDINADGAAKTKDINWGRVKTVTKLSTMIMLGATNTFGSAFTALLKSCGVNQNDADLWGDIIGTLALMAIGVGLMQNSQMAEGVFASKTMTKILYASWGLTMLSMLGNGICDILISESLKTQADAQEDYGKDQATVKTIENLNFSPPSNTFKTVNDSYRSIYRGIESYSINKQTVAQELLA